MSSLLDSVKNKKPTISRGKKIIKQVGITKEDILVQDDEMSTDEIPVNIRVNQGIRNKINALSIIGYGDTQKDVLNFLMESIPIILTEDEYKKVLDITKIYKAKDIKNYNKKK